MRHCSLAAKNRAWSTRQHSSKDSSYYSRHQANAEASEMKGTFGVASLRASSQVH